MVVALAGEDLGCHVVGRADDGVGLLGLILVAEMFGRAQVDQDEASLNKRSTWLSTMEFSGLRSR